MNDLLRDDALAIWQAGVCAVRSDALVKQSVHVHDVHLQIGTHRWPLAAIGRIEVVGAGKAGAGMAAGLEEALGPGLLATGRVSGWVNVPADCVRRLQCIHLHPARPAARNEPSPEGLAGSAEILRRVTSLGKDDLCICLISGGGSALLPAPLPGLQLDDLLQVTQALSAAGANIEQLNAVRKRLSAIQGGRLAQACRAGQLVTLIISDVIGDPLDVIASGPTVIERDERTAAQRAIEVVEHFRRIGVAFPQTVLQRLAADARTTAPAAVTTHTTNLVIGNNQTAVRAAHDEAARRGYQVHVLPALPDDATAEQTGEWLAEKLEPFRGEPLERPSSVRATCWLSGGEPVVKLVAAEKRGRGGRNQQLVLAALCHLLNRRAGDQLFDRRVILSGGTDGEDGPTDAAGAIADAQVVQRMGSLRLDPTDYLRRNDAFTFFDATGGLIRTGPTHTNVGDVRLALSGSPHPCLPPGKQGGSSVGARD
jgi:glycerate-2-kinase